MNWTDLKVKIEAASPGDVIEVSKGIGVPSLLTKITVPKGVTVVLSEPLPLVQIFGEADFYPAVIIDKMSKPEWWGGDKT